MACHHLDLGNGTRAIVCGVRANKSRCKNCGSGAYRLCDFPLSGAKAGKTCDAPLCAACSSRPAPDTDVCPPHQRYLGSLSEEAQSKIIGEMKRAAEARAVQFNGQEISSVD